MEFRLADFFSEKIIAGLKSWPKKFKKFQKSEKNAKNALTSHYANGHGDPCDKWVKNQLAASTANQVHFLGGFAIFHTRSDVGGVWKIAKPPKKCTWLAVEAAKEICNFFRKNTFFLKKIGKNTKKIVKIPKK